MYRLCPRRVGDELVAPPAPRLGSQINTTISFSLSVGACTPSERDIIGITVGAADALGPPMPAYQLVAFRVVNQQREIPQVQRRHEQHLDRPRPPKPLEARTRKRVAH